MARLWINPLPDGTQELVYQPSATPWTLGLFDTVELAQAAYDGARMALLIEGIKTETGE